jgi:hypothetical protein
MQQQLYGGEGHRHVGRWKKASLAGTSLESLDYPLLETQDEWLMHGFSYANYLQELGAKAQSTIYEKSSVDLALKDAFRKMRAFLMNTKGADRRRGNLADVDCSRFWHHAERGVHPLWMGSTQSTWSGFSTGSMSRLTTTASLSLRTSTHSNTSFGLALISWCGTNGGT